MTDRPICEVVGCGVQILNPFAAVRIWVRDGPHDVGRQITVCPDCATRFKAKPHD